MHMAEVPTLTLTQGRMCVPWVGFVRESRGLYLKAVHSVKSSCPDEHNVGQNAYCKAMAVCQ
jgi:hypothetical protein